MSKKNKPSSTSLPWKELLAFLGMIIVAYLGYLGIRTQIETPIQATQTAEAKLAAQLSPTASLFTPTVITPTVITPTLQKNILETIQFDYIDSPLNHGWGFIEGDSQPTFESVNDATVGKALKITTTDSNFYAIDYELKPLTKELGNFLEVVANYPDDKSSWYAYVEMTNNGGTLYGWLKFKVGKEKTLPSQKTTGEQEWLVYIYPKSSLDQNWVKMQIDLRKTVQETFGKDGWSFQKLIKFRIRGNLWIDSIEISEVTEK
jgi:hypothetical protein